MANPLSEIVDRKLVAVSPETSVGAAKKLAHNSRVSMLPVVSGNRLVGMVEIEPIAGKDDQLKVSQIMKKPVFVEQTGTLEDARKLIIEHGLSRLPVVDSARSMMCIGTISSSDLI